MITILTPTYNRAYCLNELYQSLLNQASKNFEWVIVDDGSSDNTKSIIREWIESDLIPIKYCEQTNSGKHIAINTGVEQSNSDWIFIVDSDDKLTEDAVVTIEKAIVDISDENTGVCFRRGSFDGEVLGPSYDDGYGYCDTNPTEAVKMFKADLAYVFRRSLLQQFTFPSIRGEKFVPELYIWNAIGDMGPIRYFYSKVIYLCEYLPDGLSFNFKSQLRKNPIGFSLFYRDQITRETKLHLKAKNLIRYWQCVFYSFVKGM